MSKVLKLKVGKFWGLRPTFVEVTGEKLVGGPFCHSPPQLQIANFFRIRPVIFGNQKEAKKRKENK